MQEILITSLQTRNLNLSTVYEMPVYTHGKSNSHTSLISHSMENQLIQLFDTTKMIQLFDVLQSTTYIGKEE